MFQLTNCKQPTWLFTVLRRIQIFILVTSVMIPKKYLSLLEPMEAKRIRQTIQITNSHWSSSSHVFTNSATTKLQFFFNETLFLLFFLQDKSFLLDRVKYADIAECLLWREREKNNFEPSKKMKIIRLREKNHIFVDSGFVKTCDELVNL